MFDILAFQKLFLGTRQFTSKI